MKRRLISLLLVCFCALIVTSSGRATDQKITYEIYSNGSQACWNGGPPWPDGVLLGEWTRRCDGSYVGWGYQPYQEPACTYTVVTYDDCINPGG
jgi:hypothetical protein